MISSSKGVSLMRVLIATISLRRNTKCEVIIPINVVDVKKIFLSCSVAAA